MEGKDSFTVAVDAMGGDFAPREIVKGAIRAAQENGHKILLVGDESALEVELSNYEVGKLDIIVVASEGVIEETDNPIRAIKEKPYASVVQAARLVKSGDAHAFVTMGSTGAAMAAATLEMGLLDNIDRPAIGGPLFGGLSRTVFGGLSRTVLMDLGSNVDCRPSRLLGFAALGVAFARVIQGIENPRVGILSVGSEEGKGNRQTKEAYPLFKESNLNFIGNVEGMDILLDKADVVVCDGFVGNILMKYTEGLGMALLKHMPDLLGASLPAEISAQISKKLVEMTSPAEVGGGGPLFGINGTAIVGHGRANGENVAQAIIMAENVVKGGLIEAMSKELAALNQLG